jgi:hypothetical protein
VPIEEVSDKDYFSWYLIDWKLAVVLDEKGYKPHVHGEVEHLHSYSTAAHLIEKEKQIFKESQDNTRRNPSAVLAHLGLDIEDGMDPGKEVPELPIKRTQTGVGQVISQEK